MVTSGKAWRKAREEGLEFTFPSGNVAAVRPIEIDLFVMGHRIPDGVAPMIVRYINGENVGTPDIPASELVEQSKDWLAFLNDLSKFAFVNPQVRDAPGEGETPLSDTEITVEDVSYADKLFLYRVIFGRPAALLRKFLDKINTVAVVDSEPDHGYQAEQTAAD